MSDKLQAMQDQLDRLVKSGASQLEINKQQRLIMKEIEKHRPLTFEDLVKKHCA